MRKLMISIAISFNLLHGMHDKTTETDPSQHSIVLQAVTEALHNKDEESQNLRIKNCVWTKKQVTCFAASAGLCATIIAATTALAINFSNCSNS